MRQALSNVAPDVVIRLGKALIYLLPITNLRRGFKAETQTITMSEHVNVLISNND